MHTYCWDQCAGYKALLGYIHSTAEMSIRDNQLLLYVSNVYVKADEKCVMTRNKYSISLVFKSAYNLILPYIANLI